MAPEDTIGQQELEQKRRDWNAHITSWQASQLSQTEYCRRHDLKFHQFVYWRRKFGPQTATPISLVQVPAAAGKNKGVRSTQLTIWFEMIKSSLKE